MELSPFLHKTLPLKYFFELAEHHINGMVEYIRGEIRYNVGKGSDF